MGDSLLLLFPISSVIEPLWAFGISSDDSTQRSFHIAVDALSKPSSDLSRRISRSSFGGGDVIDISKSIYTPSTWSRHTQFLFDSSSQKDPHSVESFTRSLLDLLCDLFS